MSSVCTVSDKGQVTLPKSLRDQLGIGPGTRLQFSIDGDGQLRAQVLSRGAVGLFGLLAKPGERARSLDEMDAAVGQTVRARAGRKS
ncbi:AbrB/MazE/SpoVT family DNA-binding domain-containing protein [Aquincola sp. S2]|uniref:AbrB/MazE/SpoVT family DNA-binding domain-containing protein n=1 Tax=Pseudaquabacterium terrae TaxID=2732868 RepID=A0ABX2EJR8_9BURK|nr:AbrB/MazE/SpoVT family DNA-binding domain-containing protein [Aquabacterium terrae]NRF68848.1 AbrB/MazE/SpoVT family DNA-binding domain-containing protein [Aquabacterium terrae]